MWANLDLIYKLDSSFRFTLFLSFFFSLAFSDSRLNKTMSALVKPFFLHKKLHLEFNLSLTITTHSLVFHLVICSICCYVIGQDGVRTLSLECNPKNLGLGGVLLATFLNALL